MSTIIGMSKSRGIVHIFVRHPDPQTRNEFGTFVCVSPRIAGQFAINIAQKTGVTLIKISHLSLMDVPASLLLHFSEIFKSGYFRAQSVSSGGIEWLEVLAVENDDMQTVKIEESVNEPKGRMSERLDRTESRAEFFQGSDRRYYLRH